MARVTRRLDCFQRDADAAAAGRHLADMQVLISLSSKIPNFSHLLLSTPSSSSNSPTCPPLGRGRHEGEVGPVVALLLLPLPPLLPAGQGDGGAGVGRPRRVRQGDANVPRSQLAAGQAVSEKEHVSQE